MNLVAYPLDPLSGDEFTAVASILQREHGVGDGWRYASIELIEPSKAELREFDGGGAPPPRRARVTCFERAANATYKSTVSLTDDRVESFEHIPGVQANFTVDEFAECDRLLRSHPDVAAALSQARHHRHRPGVLRHLDLRQRGRAPGVPRPADRLVGHLDEGFGRRQTHMPISSADCTASSTSMPWSCCASRTTVASRSLR